tara:strand:+ start:90818 stop:92599 length:1782 start_codon:yes stop_codon:yes gene_type:complete
MAEEKPKKSKVELIKEASIGLRGSIVSELADKSTDHVEDATTKLLKFHGTYQQDDRDLRKTRRKEGLGKAYSFMVRNRIPGGKMTAAQFLGELDIADELGNGTIRITTRQSIQLHGVVKNHLWDVIHRINEIKLSTQSACGDVTRNVCCCPAPLRHDGLRDQLQHLADKIAVHVRPTTTAYHEIWIKDPDTGKREQVVGPPTSAEPDPIYGEAYLPRKFKIALALCNDNCIDIYDNDLGLLGVTEGDRLVGFNVLTGGGMGTTPSKKNCFPALAKRLTFVKVEHILPIITAVIMVQRDFGNRADRSQARLKYTINNMGLPAFKAKVEEYLSEAESICGVADRTLPRPLPDPHPDDVTGHDDHMGWHEQGDGRWFLGVPIENGRIKDEGDLRLKSVFRVLFSGHVSNCRLTAQQNILLCDIEPQRRDTIDKLLADHGVATVEKISNARRFSFACPALPTCGLAVTESERALPGVIDDIESELSDLGLADEQFSIRMTGCPNGCARPYNSDVGLVGRSMDGKTGEGRYTVFLGGNLRGNQMAEIYKDQVPRSEITTILRPVFIHFKEHREPGESFGDFCSRIGVEALGKVAEATS